MEASIKDVVEIVTATINLITAFIGLVAITKTRK